MVCLALVPEMKWSKKHDRYIVNKTVNEQKALGQIKRFDKGLLVLTIFLSLFYVGLGLAFFFWA